MKCPQCGYENPEGFRFCGSCGQRVADSPAGNNAPSQTLYFGMMQQPNRAKLILIKGEGLDGVAYHLNAQEHLAGRTEGEIRFPDDPLLSPRHATFYYGDSNQLYARNEASHNGVFVRIVDNVELKAGMRFLVGEHLMEFDNVEPDDDESQAGSDGTLIYGSPRRKGYFKLIQLLQGGEIGMIFRAPTQQVTLGREGNDINFPDDPFISGQHAMVNAIEGTFRLKDLGSKNGTFVRIEAPCPLSHGDYVFMGQQLFRVEIS
jgi:pSer/pThr/pTyr-binding forkhead associated (FHA) protein